MIFPYNLDIGSLFNGFFSSFGHVTSSPLAAGTPRASLFYEARLAVWPEIWSVLSVGWICGLGGLIGRIGCIPYHWLIYYISPPALVLVESRALSQTLLAVLQHKPSFKTNLAEIGQMWNRNSRSRKSVQDAKSPQQPGYTPATMWYSQGTI